MRACTGDGEVLEFPFKVTQGVALRFYPEWWPHGEQEPARRFPHPFPRTSGPTALATCGNAIFFNAPATGRIGVIDSLTETLLQSIEIGGYPIDIVCDIASARAYIVDAARNRIVVVDTNELCAIKEIPVPAHPWSAALYGGRLYVACIKARCIAVIDVQRSELVTTIPTNAHPYQVTVLQAKPPTLRVRFLANIYDPITLNEEMPDRFEFYIASRRELRADLSQPTGLRLFERPEEFSPRRREVAYMLPLSRRK